MTRHLLIAALTSIVSFFAIGCGRAVQTVSPSNTHTLSLTPITLSVQTNQSTPLTAIDTDDAGTTTDMTQEVKWQTSSPAIAVTKGTMLCDQVGKYTVTASTATLSASASVTCVAVAMLKTVKGLQFLSAPAAIVSNAPAALTVQAIYNDGSVGDVTAKVSWTGDNVAYVSAQGIASCNGVGTANISATFGSSVASVQVACFMKHRASHAGPVEDSALFYGPFSSWLDLRRDFHAVGDGVADDTSAFRAGFAAAAQQGKVLYIPNPQVAYRITDTLSLYGLDGITIVGEDPDATRILWAGAVHGTMFAYQGSSHIKLSRVWLDGSNNQGGMAAFMDHTPGVAGQYYPTYDLIQDVKITDFAAGITAKFAGETSVNRVRFERTKTGVSLTDYNALNFNVTDCLFTDNNIGITNDPGAGAFNASHNTFVRSKSSDMVIGNTAAFSVRNNKSIDSEAVLVALGSDAAAVISVEGNVIRGVKGVPFQFSDPSVLLLVGNTFEAPADSQQALVVSKGSHPMRIFSNDNRYSSRQPFQGNLGNVQSLNEQAEADVPVSDTQVPTSVYVPPSSRKPVMEVPAQATAATIQQIVNTAAAMEAGATVHFSGVSTTNATINVPDAPELALVGDGMMTYLSDGGIPQGGPVLRTHGAVSIEDMVVGASPTGGGIEVLLNDEPNSLFRCDECTTVLNTKVGVAVSGLDNAKVNFRSSQIAGSYGFTVTGGPNQAAGRTGFSSVDAFMTTSNTFKVGGMGHFLISDGFHDGGQPPIVAQITGGATVTYDGGLINAGSGLFLNGFSGVLSMIGVQINSPITSDDASSGTLGLVGTFDVNTSINAGTKIKLSQASAYNAILTSAGLTPMPLNAASVGDIEHLLAQARTEDVFPRKAAVVPAQVVHVRHVAVASGAVAFSIGPNPTATSTTTYAITDPSNSVNFGASCAAGNVSLTGTWTLDSGNDGFYGLKSQAGYLGNVLPSGGGSGTLALVSEMTDAGQRWLIEPTGDGTFTITNRADGGVLTRSSTGCATVSAPDGSSTQTWAVSSASM